MKTQARAALFPVVLLLAACACGPAQPDPTAPTGTFTPPILTAVPASTTPSLSPVKPITPVKVCKSSADCAQGERCNFVPGCGTPSQCVPDTGCTKDLVPYCGCDGKVFEASGTCPGLAFSKKGGCGQ